MSPDTASTGVATGSSHTASTNDSLWYEAATHLFIAQFIGGDLAIILYGCSLRSAYL